MDQERSPEGHLFQLESIPKFCHYMGVSKPKLRFGPAPHVGRINILIIPYFRRKGKIKA